MSDSLEGHSSATSGASGLDARPGPSPLEWRDVDGRAWTIELTPGKIVLRSGGNVIDLPREVWRRDLYFAEHGGGLIVRVETFDCTARFVVSRSEAVPLMAFLQSQQTLESPPGETAAEPRSDARPASAALLWPKVSPLAVWALICSSLAFVPAIGLLPALIAVVLLILHRRTVRRAAAWRHSRSLCFAAVLLLTVGLAISALGVWAIGRQGAAPHMTVDAVASGAQHAARGGYNWGVIVAGFFVVVMSLSIHEAAHATTAWWLGDGYARSLGRVTLNPLSHIDPFGTILLPILLAMAGAPVFGYARPVPVRTELLHRHRRAHILISIAGPGSNLLLAAFSLMLLLAAGCIVRIAVPDAVLIGFVDPAIGAPVSAHGFGLAPAFGAVCTILNLSFVINMALAMFNMVPIPPLDGSWVLEHLFPNTLGRLYAVIRPFGFLLFLAAIWSNAFEYIIPPLLLPVYAGFDLLAITTGA